MNADPKTISPASNQNHSSETGNNVPSASVSPESGNGKGSVWLMRIRALLVVTLCATFGVVLLILPWTPQWTDNPLLLNLPNLREVVASGFVRGLASGLGLLDLWLGFWEAIHYHESPLRHR